MNDRCNSCGAPITWAAHERTGKQAPIDYEASAEGSIVLIPADVFGKPRYRVLGMAERTGYRGEKHTPHFQTCVHAKQWRSKP